MLKEKRQPLDEKAIKSKLLCASSTYYDAAILQHEVANRLLERLDIMKIDPSLIVDCGAKDGYSSIKLAKRYPRATILSLDSIHFLSSEQVTLPSNIHIKSADLPLLPCEDHSIDLLFSNLLLHSMNDIAVCFREFFRVLKPNGALLFTLLGPDSLKELRDSFAVSQSYHHVHDFIDMHHIGDLLLAGCFADPVMDMEYLTLTYASVKQLCRDLRLTGNTNARSDRSRGLMGKNRWQEMMAQYESFRDDSNVVPATFEIIYGHAWAPQEKALASMHQANEYGEVMIPIAQLKKEG